MRAFLAIAVVSLALVGCKKGDEVDEGGPMQARDVAFELPTTRVPYVPTLPGPLRVLAATPSGSMVGMAPSQAVAVTFTRPMVALGEPPEPPDGAIALTPNVPGRLRWEGSQVLVFEPNRPLPSATAFRVTFRASGIQSLEGEAARDTSWTFETPRPALVASSPQEGDAFVAPDQPIRLVFNQSVAPDAVDDALTLRCGGASVSTDVAAAGDSAVVVRHASLRKGAACTLTLAAGLKGKGGPLGSQEERTVGFRVYPEGRFEAAYQVANYDTVRAGAKPFDPERSVTLRFATPVRFGDLRPAIAVSPETPLPVGIEAADGSVSTTHTLRLNWKPETVYTITLRPFKDTYGQTVPGASVSFRTGALAPSLRIPTGVMVIEATPDAALPVKATNVSAMRLAARRLGPNDIVPALLRYDNDHYYAEDDTTGLPEPTTETALSVPRNVPTNVPMRLQAQRTGPGGTGVVAFSARVPSLSEERGLAVVGGIAQFTKLGLTVKHSPHESLVFVTDLASAQPVPGATVTIRDLSNRVRWTGQTGRDGTVKAPGWAEIGIEAAQRWQRPVQVVAVEKDGDLAFTTNLNDEGIEPWRFDLSYDWSPQAETIAGAVFTDRGLYKAGEEVNIKGLLRRRTSGDWTMYTEPVEVVVTDPRGRSMVERRLTPSATGAFDFAFTLGDGVAQGPFQITVRKPRADTTAAENPDDAYARDLVSGGFRVESFRAATFGVNLEALVPDGGLVAGDRFEAVVNARYLFGAPLGNAPSRLSLRQMPAEVELEGYDGWSFGPARDYDAYDEGDGLYAELFARDTTLDADGQARIARVVPISRNGQPLDYVLEASATDPSRQEQANSRTVRIHPATFYIGLKPTTSYVDLARAQSIDLDAIAVDPNGAPAAGRFTVELVKVDWISVREVGGDGRLRWKSERREKPVARQDVAVEAGRQKRLALPVAEGGVYLVRAQGTDVRGNAAVSETYVYAAGGGGYAAWERQDDDRIELVPDKRSPYVPGETAHLLVQSPFEKAEALVTVEREGVMRSEVVTLEGTAPQIDIPITEEMLPNAFVSVILLTGRAAAPTATADVGAPQFRVGYATLRVDAEVRHLSVEITPSKEEVRPGEEVTVEMKVVDRDGKGVPGEVTFSAADAGVLDLIGYRLPDPYNTFYGPRSLAVSTSESRAILVEQRAFGQKEEDAGGGGGDPESRLRRDFRPLAYWNPTVKTGRDGKASVTFRVPERLTTLRLMATVATADHRFGNGASETVVTQPLVLSPALPRFARQGDTFEAGVLVTNRSAQDGEASVTASAQGLTGAGAMTQRVAVKKGETKEVRFRWTTPANAQSARVTFRSTLGNEQDALEMPLAIRPAGTKETATTFARADANANEQIALPSDRIAGLGGLEARLSSTALAGVGPITRDLFTYPYGCLEQRTSAVRPLFVAKPLTDAFDRTGLPGANEAVAAWTNALEGFWTGGGFALWPGSFHEDVYTSAYVVLALAEAKAAGYAVPEGLTNDAVDWLEGRVRNASYQPTWYDPASWADARALMLYALARHGRVLDAEIQQLAAQPLSAEGDAYLLRAIGSRGGAALAPTKTALVRRLTDRLRTDGTGDYLDAGRGDGFDWIFATDTRATALGLSALAEAEGDAFAPRAVRMVQALLGDRSADDPFNTQESAALLDALSTYVQRYEKTAPNLTAAVRVAGQAVVQGTFRGQSLAVQTGRTTNLPAGQTLPVSITRSGTGPLYYALRLESYVAGARPALSNGLTLSRTYEVLDGRGQNARPAPRDAQGRIAVPAGSLVRVTLRLATPTARSYVVVDDALPAGLEALNGALSNAAQSVLDNADAGVSDWWGSFNHTELRDDRVLLFGDRVYGGDHSYVYVARATTPGTYALPAATAELMYRPEVRARTTSGSFVVIAPVATASR